MVIAQLLIAQLRKGVNSQVNRLRNSPNKSIKSPPGINVSNFNQCSLFPSLFFLDALKFIAVLLGCQLKQKFCSNLEYSPKSKVEFSQ